MKIAIVITDSKGKNLVFATDGLMSHSLDETIKLAKADKLTDVHVVKTSRGSYLRSNPNEVEKDNLDSLSISANQLFLSLDDFKYLASRAKKKFKTFLHHLDLHASAIKAKGEHIIYIEEHPLITREQVTAKLKPHTKLVRAAAKEFSIDPYTLGAILIDEVARVHPWEEAMDKLWSAHIGINTSVGIAQVKIGTVRELIAKEYYNPNPDDKKLSKENIMKASKAYLYAYAEQPRHSIRFGAARIRQIIDHWAHEIDLSNRPEIIGTLYSWKLGTPHPDPGTNDRGVQIAEEFYPLAKSILK